MTALERVRLLLVLAVGAMSAAAGMADEPDLAKWTHVAAVRLEKLPAGGVAELAIPPAVFAKARADLADLRLTAEAGQVVPYVLRVDRGKPPESVPYPARLFNPVFLPGKQSSVTADFGARAKRTHIKVDTPGTNLCRRVMVEASQDGKSWQVLRKTGWLFRITYEKGSYDKPDVVLPDNDFRYLRVTVFNAPDDPEKVEIRSIRASYRKRTPPQTAAVEVHSVNAAENAKLKATEISLDLGYEDLPLHEIEMSFEDVNFLRRVDVLGRNRQTRTVLESVEDAPPRKRQVEVPWARVTGGTVHRFTGGDGKTQSAGLRLPVSGRCRYLLIRIYNGDDAPLKFAGVKVRRLQHYLAFQPAAGSTGYRLYLGNPAAARPQYDLTHFIGRLRSEGVATVALGQLSPNPLFAEEAKVVPWSEQYRGLLWAALIAVLAVLGVLVFRQARRARAAVR